MEINELVTALRRMQVETGSLVCLGCGYEHGCSAHGCALLREAADRISMLNDFNKSQSAKMLKTIAELRAALPVWISVDKQLPENGVPVIVYRKGGKIEQGIADVNGWWRVYGTRTKNVIAWQPMPAPPETKEEANETN